LDELQQCDTRGKLIIVQLPCGGGGDCDGGAAVVVVVWVAAATSHE